MPSDALTLFLKEGIKPLVQSLESQGQSAPQCFISYAWGPAGPERDALQTWLKELHQDLSDAGFPTLLDLKNMQETVSDYMAEGVKESPIILVICTPALQARAKEGAVGQLSPTELDQLSPDELTSQGFNNLQKELWHARAQAKAGKTRVFLLRRGGKSIGEVIPDNFFSLSDYLVRDCREPSQYEAGLLGLSDPVGLIPSFLSLPNQQQSGFYGRYAQLLQQYQTPESDVLTQACFKIKAQVEREGVELALNQLSNFYVPLNAQMSQQSGGQRHELDEEIRRFMAPCSGKPAFAEKTVCLLLGSAGSGKTTYGLMLQKAFWAGYVPYQAHPLIPIRIELKQFGSQAWNCGADEKPLLEKILETQMGLSVEEIKALKCSQSRFLFVFDGYDELAGGGFFNPYQSNRLNQWGLEAKVIIGCRPEYLAGHDYQSLLGPGGDQNRLKIQEWHVSPLSGDQIESYLAKQSAMGMLEHPLSTYQAFLKETPGLSEIVSTPFLLKVFLSAYARLKATQSRASAASVQPITRHDLYEAFMGSWFDKEKQKVLESIGYERLPKGLEKSFLNFSRELAFSLYQAQVNAVTYQPKAEVLWGSDSEGSDTDDRAQGAAAFSRSQSVNPWERFFSNQEEKAIQARRGCPLRCVGGQTYSFIHQSFLEYFVADYLWYQLEKYRVGDEKTQNKVLKSWGGRYLTHPSVPVVIDFLANRLRSQEPGFRGGELTERLYAMVALSKKTQTQSLSDAQLAERQQAASNAMTVLNMAARSFAWKASEENDAFKEIQIPYVWLQTAELGGVDLSGSDLTGCILAGAKLNGANVSGCNLTDIQLNQYPSLRAGEPVNSLALSPDGQLMAVTQGREIQLFAYHKQSLRWKPTGVVLQGHTDWVRSVHFSPDGQRVVSGSRDRSVRLWGVDGTPGPVLQGHTDEVTSVSFSPDGQRVVSGSNDKTVRLWGVDGSSGPVLQGHTNDVNSVSFSPDGQRVVSGGNDHTVRLWGIDGTPGPVLQGHTNSVFSVSFSPDGQRVISVGVDHTVRSWGIDETLGPVLIGHTDSVTSVYFSPDGQRVVSGSFDDTVRLWGVDGTPGPVLRGHMAEVNSVSFSPDGQRVVSVSSDRTVRLWGIDGTIGPVLHGHNDGVTSVSFSPDGQRVASGSNDRSVRLWGVDGSPGPVLQGHTGRVNSVSFSPDGQRVVSGSDDKTVRLWGVDGTPGPVLQGHTWEVESVSFSPDGQQVVSGSSDKTVRLWGVDETPGPVLQGHTDPVESVSFSPDGQQVVSGGTYNDQTVRLWGVDGTPGPVLEGHTGWVSSVHFSPDGQRVVTGSRDATVRLWGQNTLGYWCQLWQTPRTTTLQANGTHLQGVLGLSSSNQAVFEELEETPDSDGGSSYGIDGAASGPPTANSLAQVGLFRDKRDQRESPFFDNSPPKSRCDCCSVM